MNPLKILFIISVILYFFIYETRFWLYFFSLLIIYYVITQLAFFKDDKQSNQQKLFISLSNFPGDPQIIGRVKYPLEKVEEFLQKEFEKDNSFPKGNFLAFFIKSFAIVMKKLPKINSSVVPRPSVDLSVQVSDKELNFNEFVTIRNADKLTVGQIAKDLKQKIELIKKGEDKIYNKRKFIESLLPTFLLSPFIRISGYLSSCGIDLSFIGFPKYAYGAVIITPIYSLGYEEAYLPIPGFTNAFSHIAICKNHTKRVKENNQIVEKKKAVCTFSMDHRYLDGSYGTKITSLLIDIHNDPTFLEK